MAPGLLYLQYTLVTRTGSLSEGKPTCYSKPARTKELPMRELILLVERGIPPCGMLTTRTVRLRLPERAGNSNSPGEGPGAGSRGPHVAGNLRCPPVACY